MAFMDTVRGGSVGWVVALVVLVLCILLMFLGKELTSFQALGLIAAMAVARLL